MHERSTRIRWLAVLWLMGFTFQGHFNRVSITVAGAERFVTKEGFSEELLGVVYSIFGIIYTLGMIPGGWLIDRLGPKRALTAMGVGLGTCVMLTGGLGFLPWPIASLWLPLLVIRGLAGACSAPLHPGAARSVSLWIPLSNRSLANGLVTAGALVGIAVTYPGFGWLMEQLDWPQAFLVSGAVLVVFAGFWYVFSAEDRAGDAHLVMSGSVPTRPLTPDPSPSGGRGENETPYEQSPPYGGGPAGVWRQPIRDLLACFGRRPLVLLAVSYAALSYLQYFFFYWVEFYFKKVVKLPVHESRTAAFTVTIAMAVGMACGGYVADACCQRFGRRWGYRILALVAMSSSSIFAWIGMQTQESNRIVLLFALALGSLGLCEGIFWTTAPLLQQRTGGLACAFLNTIGNAFGFVAPILTPWIGKHYGWPAALAVACIVCGMGAVLWFWIDPEPGPTG